LALAGLIGSTITAGLLLPNVRDAVQEELPRTETTSSSTQLSSPVGGAGSDRIRESQDLADDPVEGPSEEKNRTQAKAGSGLGIEQFSAKPTISTTAAPDTGASGLGALHESAVGDPAAQPPAVHAPSGERGSNRPAVRGPTRQTDEGGSLPERGNETPDQGGSAPAYSFQTDRTKSSLQPAGADTQQEARLKQAVDAIARDCAPLFPIRFQHGSSEPRVADMKQKIERLAAWLNDHSDVILYLDGYADVSGPEEYNLVLSFRRASAIATLLEDSGTAKSQLVVRAYGEGQSSAHSTEAAFERRVDLTIDAGTPCNEPSLKSGDLR
jgi:outer membrane protein OmpA-like peptidoglycan-associated protein